VAVLTVIVIHTCSWQGSEDAFRRSFFPGLAELARFSVPAFVLMSGLLVAYRQGPPNRAWLSRRLKRSLLPYVIWVTIFAAFNLLISHGISNIAAVPGWIGGGSGHLYYLLLAAQLSVLFAWRLPSGRALPAAVAGAVALQIGLGIWRLYLPLPGGWMGTALLDHSFLVIFFWLGYAAIGVGLGVHLRQGRSLPPASALLACTVASGGLLLWLGVAASNRPGVGSGTNSYLLPLLLPFTTCMCMLILRTGQAMRNKTPAGFVQITSRHSLGIYLIHPAFIYLIGSHLYALLGSQSDGPALIAFVLMYCGAFLGALVVTRLLVATPLAVLVGESRVTLSPRRAWATSPDAV
jgi:surface polysaccharide O-acyltransferase-like enzyme